MAHNKVLVMISSGEESREKTITGMRLAINLKKNNLSDEVNVLFFGPSERLIAKGDKEVDELLGQLFEQKIIPSACKAIAIRDDVNLRLIEKKVELDLASSYIASRLDAGFSLISF